MRCVSILVQILVACGVVAATAAQREVAPQPLAPGAALDPLAGGLVAFPPVMPGTSTYTLNGFDVGYDATTDRFLMACQLFYNSIQGSTTTFSYLVDSDGTVGPNTFLSYSFHYATVVTSPPRVANIAARDAFVVLHSVGGLYASVVDAATGEAQPEVFLGGQPTSSSTYDIAGETGEVEDRAVVVWYEAVAGTRTIQAMSLSVDANLQITAGAPVTIDSGTNLRPSLAIARSGGEAGRYLVVYEVADGVSVDIRGAIVTRDLQIVDQGPIAQSATRKTRPSVDGDGDQWLVAYTTGAEVECVPVFWNRGYDTAWTGAPRAIATAPTSVTDPAVSWSEGSYLVAYTASADSTRVVSVDPFHCRTCEGEFELVAQPWRGRLVSQRSGGGAGDLAMIVRGKWSEGSISPSPGPLPPSMQAYLALDGVHTDLGGGCGAGGRARATCAIPGNSDFELGVWDAAPNTPAFLALSAGSAAIPCGGGCTLVPNLGLGLVVPAGSTDVLGNAELPVPLPNDPGLVGAGLYQQWLLLTGGGCLGSLELSNGLLVVLQ